MPQPVDLGEVLTAVLADLEPALTACECTVEIPADLPTVTGDETLLRQLLQNLIDNALKYGRPDRPRPRSRIGRTGRPGLGADRRGQRRRHPARPERDRVFEMFAQVNPESRKGHGTGLSTCQRIVARHDGTVRIEDTPGGGAHHPPDPACLARPPPLLRQPP